MSIYSQNAPSQQEIVVTAQTMMAEALVVGSNHADFRCCQSREVHDPWLYAYVCMYVHMLVYACMCACIYVGSNNADFGCSRPCKMLAS